MTSKIKTSRFQLVLPTYLKNELLDESKKKGVSASEFIKDCIKKELVNSKG
jgi:hypothetical protein